MDFKMSPGMLFPANSNLQIVLFVFNISKIARPPNNPTLFQRKSKTKITSVFHHMIMGPFFIIRNKIVIYVKAAFKSIYIKLIQIIHRIKDKIYE